MTMTTKTTDEENDSFLRAPSTDSERSSPSKDCSATQDIKAQEKILSSSQDLEAAIAAIDGHRYEEYAEVFLEEDHGRTQPSPTPLRRSRRGEIAMCCISLFMIAMLNSLFLVSSAFREGDPNAVFGFVILNVMLFWYLSWLWRVYFRKQQGL